MTRETWVIARGILIDAGIEPAWAKVKTGEQYLIRDAEVVQLRRATLEEALAVCPKCAHGVQISERDKHGRWQHVDEHGECIASEIHDLIAALDKEAKGE